MNLPSTEVSTLGLRCTANLILHKSYKREPGLVFAVRMFLVVSEVLRLDSKEVS